MKDKLRKILLNIFVMFFFWLLFAFLIWFSWQLGSWGKLISVGLLVITIIATIYFLEKLRLL